MIVCVDMDHTLSDAEWRDEQASIAMQNDEWDTYHEMSKDDKPAKVMIALVNALTMAGHEVYIVTARPRKWMRHTFSWLRKHGVGIDLDHILMRPMEDFRFRPSPEMKLELTSHLKVDLFIDDREDVSMAFKKIGVTTLQVRLSQ